MIELNKPYSNKQIAQELFHIKSTSFSNKKKMYLEHLALYYRFDIEGRKIILREQLKPFETLMQKRQSKKQNNENIYRDLTHKIIAYKPLNSGSNIAREIDQSPMKPIESHKESTIVNYVRPILRTDFQSVSKKWCKINYETNTYEPLEEEQIHYLIELFKDKDLSQTILDVTASYKSGNISKIEFREKVSVAAEKTYDKIMQVFKKKYGFRPQKVSKWEEKRVNFG